MVRFRALKLLALLALAVFLSSSPAEARHHRKKKHFRRRHHHATSEDTTPPPPPQKASTNTLEEKLKKADQEEQGQPTVLAPVKLNINGPMTRDDKADRARDQEIARIKRILPKMRDPNIKADLMFQLAEAWWQKSQYTLQFREMPPWQAAADKWNNCVERRGRRACGPEPRPNTQLSETYRSSAVRLYTQLVRQYRSYPRLDEVWFILGYNKMDLSQQPAISRSRKLEYQKEALQAYRTIITNYPRSRFVCDANVELGNYFFDNNKLEPARHAFENGLACPKTQVYANYKLAWCEYNDGDYTSALKRFKQVVAASRAVGRTKDHVRLGSEALRDMVLSFQKAGELGTAVSYYVRMVGKQASIKYVVPLAGKYFEAGGYDYAIRLYRQLQHDFPVNTSAPEWQTKIVLAYDKMGKRDVVRKEIEALVRNYGQRSFWWKANVRHPQAREESIGLIEEALYNLVTDYHQEAIKTQSVKTYQLARDIYREYLNNFPKSERSYAMRFYYAEILYALEEYQKAYFQYWRVAWEKGPQQNYKVIAAKDMVLSAEKLVDIDDGMYHKHVTDASSKVDESAAKGGIQAERIKATVDKNKTATQLTAHEKQLVEACDRYLKMVPNADDEAQVRLRAAVIYFFKAQYVEASKRFAYIIEKWPNDPSSADAAGLILEALEAKQEWAELNKRATEFSHNAKLLAGNDAKKKALRKQIPIYIEGSAFKLASEINDKQKDHVKAAGMFADFAKKFSQSKFTPIALYNAFIIYQNAKELDKAVQVGEELLHDYPHADSDEMRELPGDEGKLRPLILPDLTFRLAKSYELMADFANAAKYYELYMKDFPNEKNAPDAQFNAGLWYKGLGQYDKAIAAWQKYIKIYQTMKRRHSAKDFAALNLYSDDKVTWQIVKIYQDEEKNWAKTTQWIERNYLSAYRRVLKPDQTLNAEYHDLLAYQQWDKQKKVDGLAKTIVKQCDKLDDADKKLETSKLACAHSLFITLEPNFTAYTKLKFKSDRTLRADLDRFAKQKKELAADYLNVVKIGNGDWAIAALVRIAELPRMLAKAVRESPIPRHLTPDQQDMYKSEIGSRADDIETPAVDLLMKAMQTSFDKGIYNQWTLQAESELAEFKPDLFIEPKDVPLRPTEFFFTAHTPTSSAKSGSGGD